MCELPKFIRIKSSDIVWTGGSGKYNDDFTARYARGNMTYTLRVERMDIDGWWGAFYVDVHDGYASKNVHDHHIEWQKDEKTAKRKVLNELNKYRMKMDY